MAHKNPQKGGVKKSRLKSFTKLPQEPTFINYYDPLINRKIKEILKAKNRQ